MGAIGSTGTTAANALAAEADVVIGIGTRYSDFTTASRTAFNHPDVRFVNINVASLDSVKHAGLSVVADAREALDALAAALGDYTVDHDYRAHIAELNAEWEDTADKVFRIEDPAGRVNQNQVIGLVNTLSDPRDVVVCAAGSMPGDLHKLWRTRDRKGYHVEYGFSCMGYEIAGGLGVRMADPDRDVFVMVGDGSYLMMATELATAVQEGIKLIVVLVQNHGFASIGSLSEMLGSQRFGTAYRYRDHTGRLQGTNSPSIWPPTPPATASTWRAYTRPPSSPRRSRPPRPATPAPSSTSKPTRSSPPPTANPGGTCPYPRSPRSNLLSRPMKPTPSGSRSNGRSCAPPTDPKPNRERTSRR